MDKLIKFRERLDGVRKPAPSGGIKSAALSAGIFLLAGALLGIFSKWLDSIAIDDSVWWQHLLGAIDLGNVLSLFPIWLLIALAVAVYAKSPLNAALRVFVFFAGMCVAYHISSVVIAGFNPTGYMMIWYGFTAVSPLLAVVCWYAKSQTLPSLVISSLIMWVMISCCFSTGMWYFDFHGITDTIIFLAAAAILYVSLKNTAISLAAGLIMAFVFRLPMME